jgi:hypothetical protein
MKKLFLLLCVLFALASTARATDVDISPSTIPGFQPANMPADVTLTGVSVTFNSPTVTCAANCFRQQWVGLGGFRITIEGVPYTVAFVASRSSLTLTTNYAAGDNANATVIWHKYVELRIYADSAFQPAGETYIVQPGAPGSGAWHRRVAASVVNELGTNNLYIPQITLDSTTDSLTNQAARYYAAFYRPEGAFIQTYADFESFAVPPTGAASWPDLAFFNARQVIVQDDTTYTKAQIDAQRTGCTTGQSLYFAVTGLKPACLNFGAGLQLTGDTLSTLAAGSLYHTILEEGAPLTQRAFLNFIGSSLICVDNAGATRTDCSADADLNALASNATNGFWARTGAGTGAARTMTGTANEIAVANGDGSGVPTFSLPAALTFTGKTITGGTFSAPTINGGTHTAITSLGIRSTGSGAFDLTLANTENLTAGRTLTLTLNDAARTVSLGGNLTTANSFTTVGANSLSFTTTAPTSLTLPTTGTLATLAGTETLTNKTLTSPRVGTSILDTNGNELIVLTATGSAVNEITYANAATGNPPSITASGNDANINLRVAAKGTGRLVLPGYPFNLEANTTATGNVGVGLDVLHSFSLAANSLATNLDSLRIIYSGTFAVNDNDKRIQIEIDGQALFNSGLFDLDGGEWKITVDIIRVSATSVRASLGVLVGQATVVGGATAVGAGNGAVLTGRNITVTVANLTSNAVVVRVLAEAAADNDVVQNFSLIDLVQRQRLLGFVLLIALQIFWRRRRQAVHGANL